MPLPKLAWAFDGTTTDYVQGLTGTTTGTVNYNASGKYRQSIVINNPPNTGTPSANYISYNDSTLLLDGAVGFSVSTWVKFYTVNSTLQYILNMAGPAREAFMLEVRSDNRIGFECRNNTGSLISCFSTTVPNTDTWYHITAVVTGSNLFFFLNGLVAAGPIACSTSGLTFGWNSSNGSFRLGAGILQSNGRAMRNGEFDDLRIFDTALTASQVQAIYSEQGMPGRGVQTLALPYDNIGITSSAAGLWSTRRLMSAYAGPVVNVRRNSDNATLDFIADQFGNLSNVQSVVTIDTWLTSTTGNVTTWYDQFRSNNFTQATATSQPQIVKNSGKWVVFFNRDNLIGNPTFYSRMTTPNQIFGIKTILFGINTIASTFETLLGQSGTDNAGFRMQGGDFFNATNGGDRNDFLFTGGRNNLAIGTYLTYWYNNNNFGSSLNIVNDSNPLNQWGLVIGSTPGYTSFGFNSLSDPQSSLSARAFYGYLSEVAIFTDQISQVDAGSLYATQYISRGFVTMTGTPLFTQLSQTARTSAVGAFSLRAVNGVTAKAVQIRRSSDSATQDFYADQYGNLLTVPVTGQLLQNWLGGAGANVVTWYDQSGYGNNATGSGSVIYQTSNVNMQWAVKSGSLLTVTSPSTFITNTNFTIHSVTRRTTSSQAPGGGGTAPTNQAIYALSGSGAASYNRIITLYDYQGNRFSFNSLNPTQYTVIGNTGCGLYSTSGPVDYLAVIWNGTTTQMYYNGSTSASTAAATFGNIPIASNFTLLGANAYGAVVGGEFGEIIVFNQALDTQDIAKLYSAR